MPKPRIVKPPGARPAPGPPTGNPNHDPKSIIRFLDGVQALFRDRCGNNDAQDLTAIAVRMSAWDRDRLLAILTTNVR